MQHRTTGDNITRVIGGSLTATDKAVVVLLKSSSVTTLLVRQKSWQKSPMVGLEERQVTTLPMQSGEGADDPREAQTLSKEGVCIPVTRPCLGAHATACH